MRKYSEFSRFGRLVVRSPRPVMWILIVGSLPTYLGRGMIQGWGRGLKRWWFDAKYAARRKGEGA